MSVTLPTVDLSAAAVGTSGVISLASMAVSAAPRVQSAPPHLQLFNESGIGLLVTYRVGGNSEFVPAGGWRSLTLSPGEDQITWTVLYVIPGAPVTSLIAVYYAPGEYVPDVGMLGNSPVGVGGTVATSSSTGIKNDGNGPATSLIEATPNDQVASTWSFANDGGGFLQVLSAAVLRTVLKIVRGDAGATKAIVTVGDAADTTILTVHGTADKALAVPASGVTTGVLPAGVTLPGSQVTSAVASANELSGGSFTTSDTSAFLAEILDTKNPASVVRGIWFRVWNGAAQKLALTIGSGQGGNANIDDNGNITTPGLTANPATPGIGKGVLVGTSTKGAALQTDQGGSLELGAPNAANPGASQNPYIDFHSSANARDYDSRIIASGGSTTDGQGRLSVQHNGGNATLRNGSRFAGTGTGTFSHGLGTTPNHLDILAHVNGSQTQGYDSEGATTVHITSGGGLAWTAAATVL